MTDNEIFEKFLRGNMSGVRSEYLAKLLNIPKAEAAKILCRLVEAGRMQVIPEYVCPCCRRKMIIRSHNGITEEAECMTCGEYLSDLAEIEDCESAYPVYRVKKEGWE